MVIAPERGISSTSSGAKQGIRWPYWQLRTKVRTMFWPGTKAPPTDAHSTNEATRAAEERSWVSGHAQTGPEEGCAVETPVYLSTSACGAAHIHWAKLAAAGAVTCTLLAKVVFTCGESVREKIAWQLRFGPHWRAPSSRHLPSTDAEGSNDAAAVLLNRPGQPPSPTPPLLSVPVSLPCGRCSFLIFISH